MKRRVAYTALMGGYEQLTDQPAVAGAGVDLICFTDNPDLTSDSWQIRQVQPRFPRDTVRSARALKILGPQILSEYEESLYIDNSVQLHVGADRILDQWLAGHDMAIPLHSFRTSVVAEFDAVDAAGLDDPARVYEQLITYSTIAPAVLDETPYWTGILARRRTADVMAAMQVWYEQVLRYSRRDQLSLNYALSVVRCRLAAVKMDNHASPYHRWPVSKERNRAIWKNSLGSALRVPAAEIGQLQNRVLDLEKALQQERARFAQTLAQERAQHARALEQERASHAEALTRLRSGADEG